MAGSRAATVIGTVGLLIGSCGASSAGYEMFMPRMLDMQREMMSAIQAAQAKQRPEGSQTEAFPVELFERIQTWMTVPESVRPWFPLSGVAGVLAFAALGLAALFVLLQNPLGARLLPWAAGATLAWALFKMALALSTGAFVLLMMAPAAFVNALSAVVIAVGAHYADLGLPREAPRDR